MSKKNISSNDVFAKKYRVRVERSYKCTFSLVKLTCAWYFKVWAHLIVTLKSGYSQNYVKLSF